jgi:hypothetical protein
MLRSLMLSACLILAASLRAGTLPPELEKALAAFQAEGTKGWAFTQSTASAEKVWSSVSIRRSPSLAAGSC